MEPAVDCCRKSEQCTRVRIILGIHYACFHVCVCVCVYVCFICSIEWLAPCHAEVAVSPCSTDSDIGRYRRLHRLYQVEPMYSACSSSFFFYRKCSHHKAMKTLACGYEANRSFQRRKKSVSNWSAVKWGLRFFKIMAAMQENVTQRHVWSVGYKSKMINAFGCRHPVHECAAEIQRK